MRQVAGYPLWLGHVGDVWDVRKLFDAGIQAVVDLAINEPPAQLPREFCYCRFPLVDSDGNEPWVIVTAVETVAQLVRAEVSTLVYCAAGLSRTPCIAGAALAQVRNSSLEGGLLLATAGAPSDVNPLLWKEVVNLFRA